MTTNLKRAAASAVKAWCTKQGRPVNSPLRHVYPRAYVIGKAAPMALVVSRPWQDAEKHMQAFDKLNPLDVIHTFDSSLTAGMWCALAYVVMEGRQETVAVPFEG